MPEGELVRDPVGRLMYSTVYQTRPEAAVAPSTGSHVNLYSSAKLEMPVAPVARTGSRINLYSTLEMEAPTAQAGENMQAEPVYGVYDLYHTAIVIPLALMPNHLHATHVVQPQPAEQDLDWEVVPQDPDWELV